MTLFMRAVSGLALLCFAGCSGFPSYIVFYDNTYHPGETLASGADMPVVVRGNPFAVPKPELDSDVADAMQGWSSWNDRFTATGNPNAAYRVVVVFSATSNVGMEGYCVRPIVVDGASGAAAAGRVPVIATLCRGGNYMSSTSGSVVTDGGPRGGAFRETIGHMTLLLFPGQNPQAGGNGCGDC